MEKIVITGGTGKLGNALKVHFENALFPSHAEFDVTSRDSVASYLEKNSGVSLIIHCAAMVSPPVVKERPDQAILTNIIGTSNLSLECYAKQIKLIYISTDYVFSGKKGNYCENDELQPVNEYAWSKLGGECAVRLLKDYVIIRLSFGPDVFPYNAAFTDQFTSREPASIIAGKIALIARSSFTGTMHIGGKRKTVHEYAASLGANVDKISIKDMKVNMPADTSLDCSLFNSVFNKL